MAPITRRIDYHHEAKVFVKTNLTTAVSIENCTKGTKMEPNRTTFIAVIEKAEEALARAGASPEE